METPKQDVSTSPDSSRSTGTIRVALLGCGVVGTEVVRLLTTQVEDLTARIGARPELVGIAVHNLATERDAVVDRALLTTDAESLVTRADIVVEVMGGLEPAGPLLHRAIEHGAAVVTANKELLAKLGADLHNSADAAGVDLYFEAAVAGAIPLIRPVRESLAGDRINRILGIVNGTTNYVLDQMTKTGAAFDDVVAEAQRLGYAEADPTADVGGHDAAAKAAILASLAFHTHVTAADVSCEGITSITADDVKWAKETGHVLKLLAIAERIAGAAGEAVSVRVHPALVPEAHPLANVDGAFNAVFIEAEAAGPLMFYGQGAGGAPTASAVVGDLVSAARHRVVGGTGPRRSSYAEIPILAPGEVRTHFQLRLRVADQPGVLAQVSQALAEQAVSIETVRQILAPATAEGANNGEAPPTAELVVTTHEASESAVAKTIAELEKLEVVTEIISLLRVEGA